jgi:hypothetical protein
MKVTDESIRNDIELYQARIQRARDKLDALPVGKNWQHTKKIMRKRRALNEEVKHLHGLIDLAERGLRGEL